MIIKERKKPLSILILRALLRRLPPHHPKIPKIAEELRKRVAGYKGEAALDYPLGFLDAKRYFVLHDLRLQDESRYFQIDTLVLSSTFILIIEVKNIAGTLYFDPIFNQLIRTLGSKETAFPDPLIQLKRHEEQLQNWLIKKRLQFPPIVSIVVISNPQTIVRTSSENQNLGHKVIHRDYLPIKINQIENTMTKHSQSEKELKRIIRQLKKHHTELKMLPLQRFHIAKAELIKGVICPECIYIPIERLHGTWICPKCQYKSKEAHIEAINDYFLLIAPVITNCELREFLLIHSSSVATRLLHSMNLSFNGTNKGRRYKSPFE